MATTGSNRQSGVDRQRQTLEDNIIKLRRALQHWQTWEAEYEGFKEEVEALGKDASRQDIIDVGKELDGTLLDEKEIKSLLGDDVKKPRESPRVVEVLSRRIEYVQRNIQTIEKQIQSAEHELSSVLPASRPEAQNEAALPILEIHEELDEHGNVTSSSTSTAKDEAPKLLDFLERAGIKDFRSKPDETGNGPERRELSKGADQEVDTSARAQELDGNDPSSPGLSAQARDSRRPQSRESKDSKSAARPQKGAAEEQPEPRFLKVLQPEKMPEAGDSPIQTEGAEEREGKEKVPSPPIIPTNESPSDAALRHEMLDYSYAEVGAVVAELDLDDSASQFSYTDEDNDEMSHSDEEKEEYASSAGDDNEGEEDRFGRTTRRVISEDYRREMEALEKKLNARMMQNVGPNATIESDTSFDEPEALIPAPPSSDVVPVREEGESKPTAVPPKSQNIPATKKGVRFADDLHISRPSAPREEESKHPKERAEQGKRGKPPPPPMRDAIIERNAPSSTLPPSSSTAIQQQGQQRESRFKAMRASNHLPAQAQAQPLSASIIEHPPSASGLRQPSDPALDLETQAHKAEITAAYHASRNRLIQKQRGGFVNAGVEDDEEEEERAGESGFQVGGDGDRDRDEGGQKMSLFRRARVARGS